MLDNKGFAVSTVLYTLLIAFLMFLGVALAQFSSSSSIIGKANDDIINGTTFAVKQVHVAPTKNTEVCGKTYKWYQKPDGTDADTIVQIKSRYGTKYWPKDFSGSGISITIDGHTLTSGETSGYIKVTKISANELRFQDTKISSSKVTILISNICE